MTSIRKVCFSTLFFLITTLGVAQASQTRSCSVEEVLQAGGYTYIRCSEGSNELWLSTPQMALRPGEQIRFVDAPPMVNFQSKSLGRTFSRIIFTPITRAGEGINSIGEGVDRTAPDRNDPTADSVYSGQDDNGTMVFSDDPSKVPGRRKPARQISATRHRTNVVDRTDKGRLPAENRKLLPLLKQALSSYCDYDLTTLKAITLPAYWIKLKRTIDKEGDDHSAEFFRMFCFAEFKADAADNFSARSELDNKVYPVANIGLIGARAGDSGDEEGCTASFVKEKHGWRYIDIICGARIGYPMGFGPP